MGLLDRVTRAAGGLAGPLLSRDVGPLEGTNMSLWNSIIPGWWTENGFNKAGQMWWPGDGLLADRVWITNRCIQMNAQQIAAMPVRFEAPNVAADGEPAWVSNPDPLGYPNGIGDLIFACIADIYGWGYCLLYVTSRYADGYPRNFTRVPAQYCTPVWEDGIKQYKVGDINLNPDDVIQIDRNPGYGAYNSAHGSSAIRSYAQMAWGLLAAGNLEMDVNTGGIPKAVLKVTDENRKLSAEQATSLQTQWMEKTMARGGAPPVLPPGLDFETLSWSPKDMALLETQEFNALSLATAFGIPAVLLNMSIGGTRGSASITYTNPGMLGEMWWRFELRPTGKRVCDALTAQALPSGQWVWLDAADTFLPINPDVTAFPADTGKDDEQTAAAAADAPPITPPSPVASASPTQKDGAPRLTAIGGSN
jgi:hypothetical protein